MQPYIYIYVYEYVVCVTVYVYVNMYTYMQLIYLICIYTLYNMAARCERRNAQKEELVLQLEDVDRQTNETNWGKA